MTPTEAVRAVEAEQGLELTERERQVLLAVAERTTSPPTLAPGSETSEFAITKWAALGGGGVLVVLVVLAAFGYQADLAYLRELVDVAGYLVTLIGAYVVGRPLVKGASALRGGKA